jgi:cytochrome c oxidase cbb3-type subunit 3
MNRSVGKGGYRVRRLRGPHRGAVPRFVASLGPRCGLCLLLLLLAGCEREERAFRSDPAASDSAEQLAQATRRQGYEASAYQVSEGKTNYMRFNCNGCHSNGGGGMGPALMDEKWIYGGRIEAIAASIRDGRPNGMPSFGTRVPDEQIWQIAAYVRSMSRAIRKDVAPGRNDSMNAGLAENRRPFFDPSRPQ